MGNRYVITDIHNYIFTPHIKNYTVCNQLIFNTLTTKVVLPIRDDLLAIKVLLTIVLFLILPILQPMNHL